MDSGPGACAPSSTLVEDAVALQIDDLQFSLDFIKENLLLL
jgi:hypothetical protein